MKKAITILAMIAIVAFAVFADAPVGETQRITIKSTVERKDPQFLLKGVAGAAQSGFSTPADPIDAGDVATPHNGAELLSGVDISQEDVVASFALYQTEDAKNRFTYRFTISATSLVQTKDGVGQPVAQQNAYTTVHAPVFSALDADDWYATENEGANGIASGSAGLTLTEGVATGVSANVTFNGKATVEAADDPKLAFTVTWDDDRLAPAGLYEADVTMVYTVE